MIKGREEERKGRFPAAIEPGTAEGDNCHQDSQRLLAGVAAEGRRRRPGNYIPISGRDEAHAFGQGTGCTLTIWQEAKC
jgi:hypothetical protein